MNSGEETTLSGQPEPPTPPVPLIPFEELDVVPSVPPQDLLSDPLLITSPRTEYLGRTVPSLGGIPLLAKLGQGGMGAVYYGMHLALARDVAVKVLPLQLAKPELIQRFLQEARLAGRINHPHLVGVNDVGNHSGLFFMVMDYVTGISAQKLLEVCRKRGKSNALGESSALKIIIAATKGLAAAHGKGIIHRDVKPGNILLPLIFGSKRLDYDAAKLADLGLARSEHAEEGITQSGTNLGSPGYMAPEQIQDMKGCGKPADVFGLAATFYALLAGRAPFTGNNPASIMIATVTQTHTPLRNLRADVSKNAENLIERNLSKKVAPRCRDAVEFLAALERLAASPRSAPVLTVIPAPVSKKAPQSSPPQAYRPPPKRPQPAFLVPILAAAAVIVLSLGIWKYFSANQATPVAGTITAPAPDKLADPTPTDAKRRTLDTTQTANASGRDTDYRIAFDEATRLMSDYEKKAVTRGSVEAAINAVLAIKSNDADALAMLRQLGPAPVKKPEIPPPPPAAQEAPKANRWKSALDLMARVDVKQDAARNCWTRAPARIVDGVALTPAPVDGPAILAIPYRPGEEYDLRILVDSPRGMRIIVPWGNDSAACVFGVENSFAFVEWNRGYKATALPLLGGTVILTPTPFPAGATYHESVIEVRRNELKWYLDGVFLASRQSAPPPWPEPADWSPADRNQMALTAEFTGAAIYGIQLNEVTGSGQFLHAPLLFIPVESTRPEPQWRKQLPPPANEPLDLIFTKGRKSPVQSVIRSDDYREVVASFKNTSVRISSYSVKDVLYADRSVNFDIGLDDLEEGRFTLAARNFSIALENMKETKWAAENCNYHIADAFWRAGILDGYKGRDRTYLPAAEYYKRTLEAHPKSRFTLDCALKMVLCLLEQSKLDEAERELKDAEQRIKRMGDEVLKFDGHFEEVIARAKMNLDIAKIAIQTKRMYAQKSPDLEYEFNKSLKIAAQAAERKFDDVRAKALLEARRIGELLAVRADKSLSSVTTAAAAQYKIELAPRSPDFVADTIPGIQCRVTAQDVEETMSSAFTPTEFNILKDMNFPTPDSILSAFKRPTNIGARLSGFIEVPTDGDYTFYLNSDDGSLLFIGNLMKIKDGGKHLMKELDASIPLRAGKHAFRVDYWQTAGPSGLVLSWSGPDIPKQPVPASAFSTFPFPANLVKQAPPAATNPGTPKAPVPPPPAPPALHAPTIAHGLNSPEVLAAQAAMDALMLKSLEKSGCTAASLTISDHGAIIHSRAYGFLGQNRQFPVDLNVMINIGGCETFLTAACIRQLAAAGTLDLNASLFKYLGITAGGPIIDERVWQITIGHVLEQKVGWEGEPLRNADKMARDAGVKGAISTGTLLSLVMCQRLNFKPGEKPEGSGFCFDVMRALILKATGQPEEVYLRTQLFKRFGFKEVPGFTSPTEKRAPVVWNVDSGGPLCASTSALCTFMRFFTPSGELRPEYGAWGFWYFTPANRTFMTWRADGIDIAFSFNGNADPGIDILKELQVEIEKLKAK